MCRYYAKSVWIKIFNKITTKPKNINKDNNIEYDILLIVGILWCTIVLVGIVNQKQWFFSFLEHFFECFFRFFPIFVHKYGIKMS